MYLLKVFYLGEPYTGFQRQPNGKTVENILERVMVELGLIRSLKDANYQSASRTDTGVNSIGNVIALNFKERPKLQIINNELSNDGSLYLWAWAEVEGEYRLRPTIGKTYSYRIPHLEEKFLKEFHRIEQFIGDHDFRNFIKRDKVDRPTKCSVSDISYSISGDTVEVEITGDHFGWEMIRRTIGFLLDERHIGVNPSEYLIQREKKIPLHPAPAKYLTLKRVYLRDEPEWITVDVRRRIARFIRQKTDEIDLLSTQLRQYQLLSNQYQK